MKTYPFIIVRDRAYSSFFSCGYANGYVAIDTDHPLYKKQYSDTIKVTDKANIKFNGNYIGMLTLACNSDIQEDELPIDMAIDVHGGLTFSDSFGILTSHNIIWLKDTPENTNDLWVFGFDTAHAGDDVYNWGEDECIKETLKLQSILETYTT